MTDGRLITLLVNAVKTLQGDVETLGCTCGPGEENRFHAPSRRRRDSKCTGVRLAVEHRGLVRRAERHLRKRL
jgi:hypothetical protein